MKSFNSEPLFNVKGAGMLKFDPNLQFMLTNLFEGSEAAIMRVHSDDIEDLLAAGSTMHDIIKKLDEVYTINHPLDPGLFDASPLPSSTQPKASTFFHDKDEFDEAVTFDDLNYIKLLPVVVVGNKRMALTDGLIEQLKSKSSNQAKAILSEIDQAQRSGLL